MAQTSEVRIGHEAASILKTSVAQVRSQSGESSASSQCIRNYFFFPVTSSHFSPRSFLISSTFFQASSFIWTNNARAAP